ncbi:MAG: exosortase O [Cyanobacteria bacterium J06626_14]
MSNAYLLAQSDAKLTQINRLNVIASGITIILWLYVSLPELLGFIRLIQTLSLFNIALLAGAIAVLVIHGIHHRQDWSLSIKPTVQIFPMMMMVGAAIASVGSRWFLDLEQLSVIWFVIGSYGAIGLFCHRRVWQRGLPFMGVFTLFIVLLALEFTDLGHLARTSIAEIVELLLKPFHIDAITSEDILVLSTGVAFVDIPCSGFKNIEIGSLFFILASFLERKEMGMKWFLTGVLNVILLIAANVGRILVIVVLTFVFRQQTMAEILHVPLGLFGFITVCLMTLQLLRWVPRQLPRQAVDANTMLNQHQVQPASVQHGVLSIAVMLGLALLPYPASNTSILTSFNAMSWPAEIQAESIELTAVEQSFFSRFPGAVAEKQSFQLDDVSGSMILVASPSWQAHHAPELCFTASGLTIDTMQKQALTSDVTGRWLSLDQGDRHAAYWFQSQNRTTDHYLDRVWSEIIQHDPSWTMVSILFDSPVTTDDTAVQTILGDIHKAIAAAMVS